MGRWSTGAITVNQCLQLNIANFTRYFKSDTLKVSGSIKWSTGAIIDIEVIKEPPGFIIYLNYSHSRDGVKSNINERIQIVCIPSNLGKGKVYYFICPFSGKRCRMLYMGYGSPHFKSRPSYGHRIYYPSQLSSRLDKHNDAYWRLKRKIEGRDTKRQKSHYKGQKTKTQLKMEREQQKLEYNDEMRWKVLPKAVIKSMALYGLHDARDLF